MGGKTQFFPPCFAPLSLRLPPLALFQASDSETRLRALQMLPLLLPSPREIPLLGSSLSPAPAPRRRESGATGAHVKGKRGSLLFRDPLTCSFPLVCPYFACRFHPTQEAVQRPTSST